MQHLKCLMMKPLPPQQRICIGIVYESAACLHVLFIFLIMRLPCVHSLGMIIYQMITNEMPWNGKQLPQIYGAVTKGKLPMISAVEQQYAAESLIALMALLCSNDPLKRLTAQETVDYILQHRNDHSAFELSQLKSNANASAAASAPAGPKTMSIYAYSFYFYWLFACVVNTFTRFPFPYLRLLVYGIFYYFDAYLYVLIVIQQIQQQLQRMEAKQDYNDAVTHEELAQVQLHQH